MSSPRVSICLPNLNNRPFLEERLQSIYTQTLPEWELVVVDSCSDDGAWELFQKHATRDARLRIYQAPRDGMYASFNRCVAYAKGEYIYFATSDDTMAPDCLRAMVDALDREPSVAIAACGLNVIDEHSRIRVGAWENFRPARYYSDWLSRPHRRAAFTEFCLSIILEGVSHVSLTALLVRRSLFAQSGGFPLDVGSTGDREWYWNAVLYSDVIYLPDHLATWRVWRDQRKIKPIPRSNYLEYFERSVDRVFSAHSRQIAQLSPISVGRLRECFREDPYFARRELIRGVERSRLIKAMALAALATRSPGRVLREVAERLQGINDYSQSYRFGRADEITQWLQLVPPTVWP